MKLALNTLVLTACLLACGAAAAQGDAPGRAGAAPVNDRTQVLPFDPQVVGRDPQDFRRSDTLLARSTRDARKVSDDDLYRRKLELYDGRRFYRNIAGDPGFEAQRLARVYHEGRSPFVGEAGEGKRAVFGWVGWTLAGLIIGAASVGWKRGWFVPFSQRRKRAPAAQTSATVSGKPRNRGPKAPKIELVRYD